MKHISAMQGVEFRVDPRESRARMDTVTVRAVLDLGFTEDVVKRVIEKRLRTAGIVLRTTDGINSGKGNPQGYISGSPTTFSQISV